MERKICAIKIAFVIAVVLFLRQFPAYGDELGYEPVDDPLGYADNYPYRKWCEEMFENGDYIYEGYKKIAFDIEYTPEEDKTDFWQTPLKTRRLGKGDCEDAVFLFLDYLAYSQEDAEIIWGRVGKWVDNIYVEKAHVWCKLISRDGREYIVEGFSKKWNGIIPMDRVERSEKRILTFKLSCSEFNRLYYLSSREWNIQIDEKEIWVFDGNYPTYGHGYLTNDLIFQQNSNVKIGHSKKKKIKRILKKLHKLFLRRSAGE